MKFIISTVLFQIFESSTANLLSFETVNIETNYSILNTRIATRPKSAYNEKGQRRGCNCKRSGCLKNYCECYESKVPCNENCKCLGCRNKEDRKENEPPNYDMKVPVKPELDINLASIKTEKRSRAYAEYPEKRPALEKNIYESIPIKKEKCVLLPEVKFIDKNIILGAIDVMLGTGAQCERCGFNDILTEKLIVEKYGACLGTVGEYCQLKHQGECILYRKNLYVQ